MLRTSMPPIAPVSFAEALDFCAQVEDSKGIALIIPGDLHLWGANGGNRSELFATLLDRVQVGKVVLVGDVFDGNRHERETFADRRVLEHMQRFDSEDRLHIVRGNHDRTLLQTPHVVHDRARTRLVCGEAGAPMDLSWLTRPRVHGDVVYAQADGVTYGSAAGATGGGVGAMVRQHPGSNDVLVLRVGEKQILFEHGDAYDKWARRANKNNVLEMVGKCAYDLMVTLEKHHTSFGDLSGSLKQKVSLWRGVCHEVAQGAYMRGVHLATDVHASVCGHTHYPGHTMFGSVPHVNVGSFRGYRPSFALVTSQGEVLPPVVVQHERA